jgi:hypothetical protein
MALKATFKGYYRKKGSLNPIFVYTVIGTAKELAEYAQAKANAQGLSVEDYHAKRIAGGGQYLHHITPNLAKGIGIPDSKVMNLSITPNGTVVVDDTEKVLRTLMQDEQEIRASRNASIGEHQARIALGLDKPQFTAMTGGTQVAAPEKDKEDLHEQVDELDIANQELQNAGKDGLDDQPVNQPVGQKEEE